jgi:hypothetical protein
MTNVSFEEEKPWERRRFDESSDQPKLIRMILKTGLVKDPKKANYILIGMIVVFVLFTIYTISGVL